MNALARTIRDLTQGREPAPADLNALSVQERTALGELERKDALSPRGAARMLAEAGPMQNWLSAPKATRRVVA
ncbi:MAG TPA: hypothetical protein GX714_08020 [Chloroflexi bacterium]|jgi:hypothetical protein|nr:hypothetical protein [Chloroflexota bacterium]